MEYYKLFDAEYRLMEIVWGNEPIGSTELCRLCAEKLGWKKPTTYTMLRKLCERGALKNESAVVTALLHREEAQQHESAALLEKAFDNSLPAFVAAFLRGQKLSEKDASELRALIEGAER